MNWAWQAQQLARRLGFTGLLGLLLLVGAVALYLFALHPAQAQLSQARAELAQLVAQPMTARRPPPNPLGRLATLPRVSEVPALLKQLAAVAKQQGVDLPQGHYHLSPVADGGLLRLQARYPVNAAYPPLRSFLAASLAAFPSLTVDGFTLKRTDIGATQVTGELRLSFYLRP